MIAIIDYGAGNLRSVRNALSAVGVESRTVSTPRELMESDSAILPGVGSFADAMDNLDRRGLSDAVRRFCGDDRPMLGICLGLQLLFESSEESPGAKGLGILRGCVRRFPDTGLKVPQIGWNTLNVLRPEGIFAGVKKGDCAYFVHSYYVDAADRSVVAVTSDYGVTFDAAVHRGNLYATQFHPEKSGECGLEMLRRFAVIAGEEVRA
jgi:glutamine amidotransferase